MICLLLLGSCVLLAFRRQDSRYSPAFRRHATFLMSNAQRQSKNGEGENLVSRVETLPINQPSLNDKGSFMRVRTALPLIIPGDHLGEPLNMRSAS